MNSLIPDIIDYILVFLDDKSYVNCLKTSTIFHTHRLNDINYGRYSKRLPKRLKLNYEVVENEDPCMETYETYYLEPDRDELGKIDLKDVSLEEYLEIKLYYGLCECCIDTITIKSLKSAEIVNINDNRMDKLKVEKNTYNEYTIRESFINGEYETCI